jgi:hypothetical protein
MSPNRIVAVLTPLVFAPLAGAVTAWLAEHFPGVEVSAGSLEEIFIAGALIALAPAAQWLHGWQKFEARQADAETAIRLANAPAPTFAAEPGAEELEQPSAMDEADGLEGIDELEGLDEPDELDEFDELDELDELDEAEDLEDGQLADEEQPAPTGG